MLILCVRGSIAINDRGIIFNWGLEELSDIYIWEVLFDIFITSLIRCCKERVK